MKSKIFMLALLAGGPAGVTRSSTAADKGRATVIHSLTSWHPSWKIALWGCGMDALSAGGAYYASDDTGWKKFCMGMFFAGTTISCITLYQVYQDLRIA